MSTIGNDRHDYHHLGSHPLDHVRLKLLLALISKKPRQQIGQTVSRQNHPSVSNPARARNVSRRQHRSRCDRRAIHTSRPRTPNPPIVTVGNLRRNLETFFSPRLKGSARKFRKLAPLKLLAVSERRGLVS
jgi:hypothetical protein